MALHELKTRPFSQPKHRLFEQAILLSSNVANFRNRHHKFPPSHNLLSAKNKALLLMFALTPYAVTPKRRTDSKPFRRRFVRKTGFGSCRRKFLQKYFWQSFESRSQDGVPRAFWFFSHTQKVTIRSLTGSSKVLRTSNQRTQITPYHEQNEILLKLSASQKVRPCRDGTLRVLRGSANLEVARRQRRQKGAVKPRFTAPFSVNSVNPLTWRHSSYAERSKERICEDGSTSA